MSITSYLKTLPFTSLIRSDGPPKNAIPFVGYLRQHPAEKNKLILIKDPLGENPTLMEFKSDDMVGVEEFHSPVTLGGEAAPLIKLFIRKGARGVILEPFEVDDPIRLINKPGRFLPTDTRAD
jgi:hypothetical protein